jgi:flagellar protein FliO/FliZ
MACALLYQSQDSHGDLRTLNTTRASKTARISAALLSCAIWCQYAGAQAAAGFAAPTASSVPGPAVSTLRVTLAMILVLGAVLAAAWLARRMRVVSAAPAGGLQVLAQVSLGKGERAVLLRVGERQVLIGVAPGSVRTLHVLEAPTAGAAAPGAAPGASPDQSDANARPSFKSLLLKSLGK